VLKMVREERGAALPSGEPARPVGALA
jgi:hypothetical protein